jgi:hypothetical protein
MLASKLNTANLLLADGLPKFGFGCGRFFAHLPRQRLQALPKFW